MGPSEGTKQKEISFITNQNSVQHLPDSLNDGHLSSPYYVLGVVRDNKYTFLSSRASKGRETEEQIVVAQCSKCHLKGIYNENKYLYKGGYNILLFSVPIVFTKNKFSNFCLG